MKGQSLVKIYHIEGGVEKATKELKEKREIALRLVRVNTDRELPTVNRLISQYAGFHNPFENLGEGPKLKRQQQEYIEERRELNNSLEGPLRQDGVYGGYINKFFSI